MQKTAPKFNLQHHTHTQNKQTKTPKKPRHLRAFHKEPGITIQESKVTPAPRSLRQEGLSNVAKHCLKYNKWLHVIYYKSSGLQHQEKSMLLHILRTCSALTHTHTCPQPNHSFIPWLRLLMLQSRQTLDSYLHSYCGFEQTLRQYISPTGMPWGTGPTLSEYQHWSLHQ